MSLLSARLLVVDPELACLIGLNEAIILQQIAYWLQRSSAPKHQGKSWVYNSIPKWAKQFPFLSHSTIQRAITSLEKRGLLITANYNKDKRDKTKWYSINFEVLHQLEAQGVKNASTQVELMEPSKLRISDPLNLIAALPETNTKINKIISFHHNKVMSSAVSNDESKLLVKNGSSNIAPPSLSNRLNQRSNDLLHSIQNHTQPQLQQSLLINYQTIVDSYNTTVANKLPRVEILSDKRKRAIKRLLSTIPDLTEERLSNYFKYFVEHAGAFYFGENERGWRANFDYLIRPETYIKAKENTL